MDNIFSIIINIFIICVICSIYLYFDKIISFIKNLGIKVGTEISEDAKKMYANMIKAKSIAVSKLITAKKMTIKMMAKTGLSPIQWSRFSFDIFGASLDFADPGGYANVKFLEEYIKNRDKTNKLFNDNLIKNGITPPLVISSLSKLPDELPEDKNSEILINEIPKSITQLNIFIINEYITNYVDSTLPNILATSELSETEISGVIDNLIDQASKYFDTPEGDKYLLEKSCQIMDGIIVGDSCSYKNKETCDSSYDWSKISDELAGKLENSGETYVEWIDNKCVHVNPVLRSICETDGFPYNYEKQVCELSEKYCRTKGMEPVETKNGIDCTISKEQNIAEMVFGKTITRGLIQVFDPAQYESCKKGEYDFNDIPEKYKIAISILSVGLFPTLGNILCLTDKGCMGDKKMENELCYDQCKDGFKSDGATMCYKQYPEFEKNGELHSIISISKNIVTNTGTIPNVCPTPIEGDDTGWVNTGVFDFMGIKSGVCVKKPTNNKSIREHYKIDKLINSVYIGEWAADEDYEVRDGDFSNYWLKPDKLNYWINTKSPNNHNKKCVDWYQIAYPDVPPNCPAGCKNITPRTCNPGGCKWCDKGTWHPEIYSWGVSCERCGVKDKVLGVKICDDCGTGTMTGGYWDAGVNCEQCGRHPDVCAGGECTLCNTRFYNGECKPEGYSCPDGTEQSGPKNTATSVCLSCDEGYRLNSTKTACRISCKDGYNDHTMDGFGFCVNKKPLSLPIPESAKKYTQCVSSKENIAGLCYDKCKEDYHMQSLGLCSQKCPSGSNDIGLVCIREAYNRGIGEMPFSVYMKKRLVPYGTADGPSPAELTYDLVKEKIT